MCMPVCEFCKKEQCEQRYEGNICEKYWVSSKPGISGTKGGKIGVRGGSA